MQYEYEIVEQSKNRNSAGVATYELSLRLAEFHMPERMVEKHSMEGRLGSLFSNLRDHASAITAITLEKCDWARPDEAGASAEYLTGTCPYCGVDGDLLNGNWRVAANQTRYHRRAQVVESGFDAEPGLRAMYAACPAGRLPLDSWDLVALEDCGCPDDSQTDIVVKPYGKEPPYSELTRLLGQIPLPFDEDWTRIQSKRLGSRLPGYMGIYQCQHCGGYWYARTAEFSLRSEASGLAGPPINTLRHIKAVVKAGKRWIKISFDKPVGPKGFSRVAFDTVGGLFEVDGVQGFKSARGTRDCLGLLPLDFECPGLLGLTLDLLAERIGSIRADSATLACGRANCEGKDSEPLRIVDLALANRFRGYPDSFYRAAYEGISLRTHGIDSASASWRVPEIRLFEGLPVDFHDIPDAYAACGLPDAKSIRRLAFKQPWLIAYAFAYDRMPFDDVNLLRAFLSGDNALEKARLAACGARNNIFEYVKETRGELAAWKMLTCPPIGLDSIIYLSCDASEIPPQVRNQIGALPLKRAVPILESLALYSCDHSDWEQNFKKLVVGYEYAETALSLQGDYGQVRFRLPGNGLELIAAGDQLKNCLGSYVCLQGNETYVVEIFHETKLAGAVEVDLTARRVLQARGPCNRSLEMAPAIHRAFRAWAVDKGIEYEEAHL